MKTSILLLTLLALPSFAGAEPYPLWSGPAIPSDPGKLPEPEGLVTRTIQDARESDYKFLHGAAIVHFKGTLFANWANSPIDENKAHETLQGRRSTDGGKTWSGLEVIGSDLPGADRRSHAAYLKHKGQLWTFAARFGTGDKPAKRFKGLQAEAFVLNEKTDKWDSKGIVMTNCWPYEEPVLMGNGNYIVAGQDKDGKPVCAISHGDDLTQWDTVLIPYPSAMSFNFGETTVWAEGTEVTAVIRNTTGAAWVATSIDGGRTWAEPRRSNMPMPGSKAYLGKLSTGQLYMVSNLKNRNTLVVSVGKPGEKSLSSMWRIRHGSSKPVPRIKGFGKSAQWSYPYGYEHDGKLYIVYSIGKEDCGLSVIPIESLKANEKIASNSESHPAESAGTPETHLWNPEKPFPSNSELLPLKQVRFNVIKKNEPEVDSYSWLHGAALIWHKGELFTFFGNNAGHENTPTEVARESRSRDQGKTWGPVRMLAAHTPERGRSHGAYISHANELWALVGQIGNDERGRKRAIVETLAYRLNEKTDQWQEMGLAAKDFWPVDEPTKMAGGNWIVGGMSDCVDGKAMPSVAISKGTDFSQWDVVRIPLPMGTKLWGETSVIVENDHVVALVRNKGEVLASVSKDQGRTWSVCTPSGIKSSSTKVFAGKLSTGQRYAIGTLASDHGKNRNMNLNRSILSIAVSRPGEHQFHSVFKIRNNSEETGPGESAANGALSYPYAVEHEGFLYVAYSNDGGRGGNKNSAELAVIPIESLRVGIPADYSGLTTSGTATPRFQGTGRPGLPLKGAPADVKISFHGLGDQPCEDVSVLGTLFRTKTGEQINFIPVDSSASGVWTKDYTQAVATAALTKIKPGMHGPVLVVCDISTTHGKPAQGGPPGVTTGVFHGPIHTAAIREVKYLSMKEAEAFANKHIEDEAQRSRFLSRIGAAQPSPFSDPEERR